VKLGVVIGRPVEHSLSPAMHNAAFESLDLPWKYFALSVPEGRAADAVDAMRAVPIAGMSVTMPHKSAVVGLVDACTSIAAELAAVNCLWWRGEELVGDNTDGAGFVDALRHDEGYDPADRVAVVLGAGGAARAVVRALAEAGAREVVVVNRTAARAEAAVALAGPVGRLGGADAVADADLVVNATSVGMGTAVAVATERDLPLDPARLGAGQLVVDLVYEPATTALVRAAREQGAVAVNGLGMLIHQAAHAFRLWTGEDPPVEVMSAAATAELARRS
jgi:shikimate dehydrogenase